MAKRKNSITISPKHGLNPSILKCPICGKDMGIAVLGKLKGDAEAPKEMNNNELCDDCKKKYITLLIVEKEEPKPHIINIAYIKREVVVEHLRDNDKLLITKDIFDELTQNTQQ